MQSSQICKDIKWMRFLRGVIKSKWGVTANGYIILGRVMKIFQNQW